MKQTKLVLLGFLLFVALAVVALLIMGALYLDKHVFSSVKNTQNNSELIYVKLEDRPISDINTDDVQIAWPDTIPASVSPPFKVSGKINSGWIFEANLPYSIIDVDGKTLYRANAYVKNWTQPGMVDFEINVDRSAEVMKMFDATSTYPYARFVIENDNASGLPENSSKFYLPINLSAN